MKQGLEPLKNPRWEKYCLARAEGKTQVEAQLLAYPQRKTWKRESLRRRGVELDSNSTVIARIKALQKEAAKDAIATRAEILRGMTDTYRQAVKDAKGGINQTTATAVNAIGKTLLDNLPTDTDDKENRYCWDFGVLLAPPHLAVHRKVSQDTGGDFVMFGGRLSAKSSTIALEIGRGMMMHPERSAYITMERQNAMRDSVYNKMLWALNELNVADAWDFRTSPLSMIRKDTGQIILFRGCDKAAKSKGAEAPPGTYFAYQWYEECDQLKGLAEIRTVSQSLTRNAPDDAPFFKFYSFNPPRSKDSWANRWLDERVADGLPVYKSSYLDMPPEWVPNQFKLDALTLKEKNPQAYAHEYLGEPVGFGNSIFENVQVRTVEPEERANISYHFYGIDWGFSKDPFVWVKLGYDAKRRVLYVLDEYSGIGLTNAVSAQEVTKRMSTPITMKDDSGNTVELEPAEPYAEVMCDAAEPKSIADFQGSGIKALAAPKQGAHNVRNSIKWLQQRTAIVVDPKCKLAAKEFPAYAYELTKDGEITSNIPDLDNHAIDATRYACARLIANREYI